jgi:hypothetical protein
MSKNKLKYLRDKNKESLIHLNQIVIAGATMHEKTIYFSLIVSIIIQKLCLKGIYDVVCL